MLRGVFGITLGGSRLDAPVGAGRRPARAFLARRDAASRPTPATSTPTTSSPSRCSASSTARRRRPHPRRRGASRPPTLRVDIGGRSTPSTGDFDHRPARRRRRARQRHPVRELRARAGASSAPAWRAGRSRPRRSTSASSGRRRQRHRPEHQHRARRGHPPDAVSGVIGASTRRGTWSSHRGGGGRALRRGGRPGHEILERELAASGLPPRPGPRAMRRSSAPTIPASSSWTASSRGTRPS